MRFSIKVWKTIVPMQHVERFRKLFEQESIWECLNIRKLGPHGGESTIFEFWQLEEQTRIQGRFEHSLWILLQLDPEKTRFSGMFGKYFFDIIGYLWYDLSF